MFRDILFKDTSPHKRETDSETALRVESREVKRSLPALSRSDAVTTTSSASCCVFNNSSRVFCALDMTGDTARGALSGNREKRGDAACSRCSRPNLKCLYALACSKLPKSSVLSVDAVAGNSTREVPVASARWRRHLLFPLPDGPISRAGHLRDTQCASVSVTLPRPARRRGLD